MRITAPSVNLSTAQAAAAFADPVRRRARGEKIRPRSIVVDHLSIDLSSIAGGATAVGVRLATSPTGDAITPERFVKIELDIGSAVNGAVAMRGPFRIDLPADLATLYAHVRTDVGTAAAVCALSYHDAEGA